jgi:CubicO group peptidase (beta-lactamase class C family)
VGRYGAHFWLEVPEEYAGRDAHLPVPAFHAAGHEAQFVTIVPSYDLVIVRLGRTRYPEAWDHPTFVRDVLAALDSTEGMSAGADWAANRPMKLTVACGARSLSAGR